MGCKIEKIRGIPTPTPTPSPTPSPTPPPTPTPTPTPAASSTQSDTILSSQLAKNAAETNADIILAASRDALRKTEEFQNTVATLANTPESQEALTEARESLAVARSAYRQAEVAVFYTDFDAPTELLVLPDPDNSTRMNKEANGFGVLETLLDAYSTTDRKISVEKNMKNPDEIVIQSLIGHACDLHATMEGFVGAWERNDPTNFRNRYFAKSQEDSIRRIFQGFATMIDAVLPERSQGGRGGKSDLMISLSALRNLYLGTYQTRDGTLISGPGIRVVIEQADSKTAQAIDSGFLSSMGVVQKGNNDLVDENSASPLEDSLVVLKSEWIKAANSLSLTVEESSGLSGR